MDKQTVVHPDNGVLFSVKKKWAISQEETWRKGEKTWRKVKKPIWKGCTLYDYNHVTFWKRQNSTDRKSISGCQGLVGRGMHQWSREGFLGQWIQCYNDRCVSWYICPNLQNIQHQAWVLTSTADVGGWWPRFLSCNRCTARLRMLMRARLCLSGGRERMGNLCTFPSVLKPKLL